MPTLKQHLKNAANAISLTLGKPVTIGRDEGCVGGFYIVVHEVGAYPEIERIEDQLGARSAGGPTNGELHFHFREIRSD